MHLFLFRDADQMAANYMFLTGSQFDYIQTMKAAILAAFDNLESIERKVNNYTPENENTFFNAERLERWYFAAVKRYTELCRTFEMWLYHQGYFATIAGRKDTPKTAVLINA
jgi:hypothetical protein